MNHETIYKIIEELKAYDWRQSVGDKQIQESLTKLIETPTPIPRMQISDGARIVRIRFNEGRPSEGNFLFRHVDELGRIKNQKVLCSQTTLQRASLPGKSVFYGVLENERNDEFDYGMIATAVTEIARDREGFINHFGKYFTLSVWYPLAPLQPVLINQDRTFHTNNRILQNLSESEQAGLLNEPRLSEDDRRIYEAKWSYFSSEFAKFVNKNEDYNYYVSAHLSNRLMNMTLDSKYPNGHTIVYPTTKNDGRHLNIAMNAALADKVLKLGHCVLWKIEGEDHSDNHVTILPVRKGLVDEETGKILDWVGV